MVQSEDVRSQQKRSALQQHVILLIGPLGDNRHQSLNASFPVSISGQGAASTSTEKIFLSYHSLVFRQFTGRSRNEIPKNISRFHFFVDGQVLTLFSRDVGSQRVIAHSVIHHGCSCF